jgi:hypothetical protein
MSSTETHQIPDLGNLRRGRPANVKAWSRLAVWGGVALVVYLSLALHSLFGDGFRLRYWAVAVAVSWLAITYWAKHAIANRDVTSRPFVRIVLVTWSVLLTLLAMDVLYGLYYNTVIRPSGEQRRDVSVPEISVVEFHDAVPKMRRDPFVFTKPHSYYVAKVYGDLCAASDLRSATIREKVIEFREMDIEVDQHGYRKSIPLSKARMILLGDSFAWGNGVFSTNSFVHKMNVQKTACYNLGHCGCGLPSQIQQLDEIAESEDMPESLEWIVWLVFDGNDLEDSVDPFLPPDSSSRIDGTVFDGVMTAIEAVRYNSVLSRALSGQLYVLGGDSHQTVDGIHLRGQLYRSNSLGYKLFNPPYVTRAAASLNYVESHSNRKRISKALARMKKVAEGFGARVLVVVAPSAPRVHGPHFEDFPELQPPHFANFVFSLAQEHDFETLDLLPIMQKYAGRELLFHRDDTHWNPRGHEVTAQAIVNRLKQLADR